MKIKKILIILLLMITSVLFINNVNALPGQYIGRWEKTYEFTPDEDLTQYQYFWNAKDTHNLGRLNLCPITWTEFVPVSINNRFYSSECKVYDYNFTNKTWTYRGMGTSSLYVLLHDQATYANTVDLYYFNGTIKTLWSPAGYEIIQPELTTININIYKENSIDKTYTQDNNIPLSNDIYENILSYYKRDGYTLNLYNDSSRQSLIDINTTLTTHKDIYLKYTLMSNSNNSYVYKNGQAILFNDKNLSEYNWLFSANAGFDDRLILLPKEWDQIQTSGNGTILNYALGIVYSYNTNSNTWTYLGKSTDYGPFVCYAGDSNIYSTTIDCYYKYGNTKTLLAPRGFGIPNYEQNFYLRFEDLENNLINFITITGGQIDIDQKNFILNDLTKVGFKTEYYTDIECNNIFDFDDTITQDMTIYVKYTEEVVQSEIDFPNMITYNFDESKDFAIISQQSEGDIYFAIDFKYYGFELHHYDLESQQYISGESTCPVYYKKVGKWYIYKIDSSLIPNGAVLIIEKQQLIESVTERSFLSITKYNVNHFTFALSNNAYISYSNDLTNVEIYDKENNTTINTNAENVQGGTIKDNSISSIFNEFIDLIESNKDNNVFKYFSYIWTLIKKSKLYIYIMILIISSLLIRILKAGNRK